MTTVVGRQAVLDVADVARRRARGRVRALGGVHGDAFHVFLGDVHAGERRKIVARVRVTAGATGALPVSTARLLYVDLRESAEEVAEASVDAEVTADLARIDRSVDADAGKQVMRAVSGAGLQAAANAYGRWQRPQGTAGARRRTKGSPVAR
jgi:hypothetical protein